jgi:hypothetical protein
MATYPKTDKEYLAKIKLAAAQPTRYWNEYPYNLGYYHSDGVFSFDCVNLVKAILNGWDAVKRVGYFVNDFSRTGDCNEWGLLSQCPDYSTDFSNLHCLAVLYMPGHIGTALGEEVTRNGGKVYNVIECTGAWGGGVLYSYVDSKGRRFNHKGGSQAGTWTHWGKMSKWLKYTEAKQMNFSDVTKDNPKYKHMKTCYDAGLINGYEDGTFRPKNPITREDVCVILSKLLKKLK